MREQRKAAIIFSVNQKDNPKVINDSVKELAVNCLTKNNVDFKEIIGSYKGTKEPSFCVNDNPENREIVLGLAKRHCQESILLIDSNLNASLLYTKDNSQEKLGKFIAVNETEAKKQDSWTLDPERNQFWTTTKEGK